MRSVLITGGSGFLGKTLVRCMDGRYGYRPHRICIFSRDEHKQAAMREEFQDDRLRFFIGDVRDRDRLWRAMRGVDVVIHAAALKRIEVGAYNPDEMVKTNVVGAMNVIGAAELAGVERVVLVSTDKAYQPISPYGLSKAMAESMFLNANRGFPVFSVCRYGNVWGSTGSVAPRWKRLAGSGVVPVTDPHCTRFFMRPEEAASFVFKTVMDMPHAVAVPDLPAYRLGDLAEAFGARMQITGLPAYEKLHESMDENHSSDKARRMTVDELKEAICSIG